MTTDLLESAANVALGLLIGWLVLRAFDIPAGRAIAVQGAIIVASFARQFILRRLFRLWSE